MTVSSTPTRINQDGNGVTLTVPITFPFQAASHIKAIQTVIATGVQTVLVDPTNYSVSGTQNALGHFPNGGTVTLVVAPASTIRTTVYLDPPQAQALDLTENNSLPAESVEAAIDYQTMLIKRTADLVVRTMRQPDGDETTIAAIPSKVARVSKFAAWDSNGDPIAAAGTSANLTPVSSFVNTVLDDVDAPSFRGTIGFPTIAAKGDSIHGTGAGTLGLLAAGVNGDIELADADAATGFVRSALRPHSIAPNPFFQVDQLVNNLTVVADDAHGHDHWYVLTQTASIQVSSQTLQEDGSPSNARLTQNQAVAQRMGYACIIESNVAKSYLDTAVTFRPRIRISASQPVRCAMLSWTNTADVVTSDIVNDWTSTDYTTGAAKFFSNVGILVQGTTVITPTANQWTDLPFLFVNTGAVNNIILFIWTEGAASQNVTLDISHVRLVPGLYKGRIHIPTFHETLMYAQRFFQKSFNYSIAPGQNTGSLAGAHFTGQPVGAATAFGAGSSRFPVQMLGNPAMATYNPSAANFQMRNVTTGADCSATGTVTGQNAVEFSATSAAGSAAGNRNLVHWTADTRL